MSNVPVLILIYNRPDYTKKLIKNLRKIRPKKIFIFCDGPKSDDDEALCQKAINESLKIDWNCSIKKNFLKTNLGCRDAVSKAINWFFKKNTKGIILEDDCLPNKAFFEFCEKMLRLYEANKEIGCITGDNFLLGNFKFKKDQYYLSKYPNCWGWATWKRSWNLYEKNISFWPKLKKSKKWNSNFLSHYERKYWNLVFDTCYNKKVDSWAYLWTLALWKNKLLTVTPSKNLVQNIGFISTRRYFKLSSPQYKTQNLDVKKIKINNNLKINQKADNFVFEKHFKGKIKILLWNITKIFNYYGI